MGVELNAANELGETIRRARVAANLTQSDLGEFCGGVDRHVIAAIERGAVTTQVQRLFDVLDVLGLDIRVRPRTHRFAVTVPGLDAGVSIETAAPVGTVRADEAARPSLADR